MREIVVVDGDDLLTQRTMVEAVFNKLEVDEVHGCWLWTGQKNGKDYGMLRGRVLKHLKRKHICHPDRTCMPVHAYVYYCYYGPFPARWTIDHVQGQCPTRDPRCCNPEHLEAVPNGTNVRRMTEANTRPFELMPPLFDPQCFDEHLGDRAGQQLRILVPAEVPVFRATRLAAGLQQPSA